jgi:flagellar hook-length control protein FliK
MSEGQIMTQTLVGTPSAVAMPVASPVTSLPVDEQEANAFAGLLRGLSAHVTTKPVVGAGAAKASQAGNSDAMGTETASPPDSIATLLAMADVGKEVAPLSPAVDEPGSGQPEKTGQQKDTIPQNVVLSAAGIQVLPVQQINGRMPESAVTQAVDENAAPRTAEAGESFRGHAVVMPETAGAPCMDTSAMPSPVFAGILTDSYNMPTSAIQQNAVASASVQQGTPTAQVIVPPTTQPAADTTATKYTAVQEPVRNVLQGTPVTSINVVSASPEPEGIFKAEPVNTSGDAVSKLSETATTASLVRPALDAYFQTSVAPSSNSMAGTAPAGQEMSPLPAVDAVTRDTGVTLAGRIPVDGKRNGLQVVQEAQSSKSDATETANSTESRSGNVVEAAIKKVTAPANGESSGQDGKGASDQKTGAQDTMMLLHQLKVESAPVAAGTSGASANEPVRANVMEQVISHLAGRDIKSGVEQVVIRLSPDNLGELKLNLRMENQCLKVEIVAENSAVRDTLMKHADTLKETLSRQNITMETFDVSTGSNKNGFGSNGQSQANWQELARQQQNSAWNASGGYRINDVPEIPQRPLYQASTEHSMVDVHF